VNNAEILSNAMKGEETEAEDWVGKVNNVLEEMGGKLEADTAMYDEYKKAINDPQLIQMNSEVLSNQQRLSEINKQIRDVAKEVDRQYGALPAGQRIAIINERTAALLQEKDSLTDDTNMKVGMLNMYYDLAKQNLEVDEAKMGYLRQTFMDNVELFQDAFGIYWQTEGALEQEKQTLELEESFKNPNLESSDPAEQQRALKQTLQSYYDTYGQIIQRDINTTMQDVMNYAKANGVSLTQALQTNFVDQLKNKAEYQELTRQALGYGTPLQRAELQADIDKYNLQYGEND
jgi:uncharacterized protein YoxC